MYRARDGRWYDHKETRAEYGARHTPRSNYEDNDSGDFIGTMFGVALSLTAKILVVGAKAVWNNFKMIGRTIARYNKGVKFEGVAAIERQQAITYVTIVILSFMYFNSWNLDITDYFGIMMFVCPIAYLITKVAVFIHPPK